MLRPDKARGEEIVVHPQRFSNSIPRVLYVEPMQHDATPEGSPFLVEYWNIGLRRLPLIISLVIVGCLLGVLYSFSQMPVYRARVSLEIQNPSESTLNLRIADLESQGATISPESYLPTQIQILQSRTLGEQALAKLKPEDLQEKPQPPSRLLQLLRLTGITSESSGRPAAVDIDVQGVGDTRIVEVFCDSTSPRAAATYANALANEYIDSNLNARLEGINHSRDFLNRQLEEIRGKLQDSQRQLQDYGRTSNLVFTADKGSIEQEKFKELQVALSQAQADRITKQSAYQIASSSPGDTIPQVLDSARLSDYQAQLAGLRRQRAELGAQFTSEHPKVKQLQAQIDQLESTFQKERDNILTRIRNEYQAALMKERLLDSAYKKQAQLVSAQTQQSIDYSIREREVDTNRQLYDSLLEKAKEADIASAMRNSNVRIIDPAKVPSAPYKPNLLWNTLVGCISGLMGGIALVLGWESLDCSFKVPGEMSYRLHLPELGAIPAEALQNGHRKANLQLLTEGGKPSSVELVTWQDASSMVAESFRGTLASILCSHDQGTGPRVIMVTSTGRAEGKTTVVSNLGIALSQINQRVLLIDADARKPRLHEIFNVSNNWGLSDLLREKSSLHDIPLDALVQRTQIPNLSILTSGPCTTTITSLLHSSRMLELLQRLRCEFDTVLLDTPPMLSIPDARIVGRLVDGAILVCRANKTTRHAALAAKRRLTEDRIPVLGTILNAWDEKSMSRYGYDTSYYSYQQVR